MRYYLFTAIGRKDGNLVVSDPSNVCIDEKSFNE